MELTADVQITDKGVEEVAQRKFKLSIKKRSVLIQLSTQKTVQALCQKSVYPPEELLEAIQSLADEGFVTLSTGQAQAKTSNQPSNYDIAHPSSFRFVVNEKADKPDAAPQTSATKDEPQKGKGKQEIVRVNSFRFIVKE